MINKATSAPARNFVAKFKPLRKAQSIMLTSDHVRKHKHSLPQSYFVKMKDHLENAPDKDKAVGDLMPEVQT